MMINSFSKLPAHTCTNTHTDTTVFVDLFLLATIYVTMYHTGFFYFLFFINSWIFSILGSSPILPPNKEKCLALRAKQQLNLIFHTVNFFHLGSLFCISVNNIKYGFRIFTVCVFKLFCRLFGCVHIGLNLMLVLTMYLFENQSYTFIFISSLTLLAKCNSNIGFSSLLLLVVGPTQVQFPSTSQVWSSIVVFHYKATGGGA